MSLKDIISEYIRKSAAFKAFLKGEPAVIKSDGLDYYPLSMLSNLISRSAKGRVFAIFPTDERAKSAYDEISSIDGGEALFFPSNGKLLYSDKYDTSLEYQRLDAIKRIREMKRGLIVASLRSFSSPVISLLDEDGMTLSIKEGDRFDFSLFSSTLSSSGYYKSPNCYEEGTFSIRGEVMDIFPFTFKNPIRLYADFDIVGKIGVFDPMTQKSMRSLKSVDVPLLRDEERSFELTTLKEVIKEDDYFILSAVERINTSWQSLKKEARARFSEAYKKNADTVLPERLLFPFEDFQRELRRGFLVYDIVSAENFHYRVSSSRSYFGNVRYFREDIKNLRDNGWRVNVIAIAEVQRERLLSVLSEKDVEISIMDISSGFEISDIQLLVVMDKEIFGRRKERSKAQIERVSSSPLDAFVELKSGDYVVHVGYGVGQFEKIERIRARGNERDYIKIKYDGGEFLYVPIEQANLVQKYIGSDSKAPKLDKIGSISWTKKKEKARESAEKLAKELVVLYREREKSSGFQFMKDNDWQIQFEASFPFTETPDQLKCIEEVKRDMESPKVMDRLICGDVGYGKTEIAFRAAFKAILSNKQVVFMAPTVILAEQHYENFLRRIGSFPINVGILTRFVSYKKQRDTILGLENGKVDIVFGTHKLLNKNLKYRDLGLLITDEEQRFGVRDKEKIKQMKTSVDSLTLSATPIPRTLYMSLLKVRDMSLLTTAPRERQAVDTFIEEYSLERVKEAILRETKRGGQVFYLHNRIEDIDEVVRMLQAELPSLIIEAAHGQMDSDELEDKMHRFIYEGVQVLVSTTIIENGIDIPNVNTIIIDRSDRFGLSQLYQLRGRVGRSDRQAYCYLLYPKGSILNEDAIRRLKVLSDNTGLGSGFKVAMKDMEIRGAGNILGKEQSGHLEKVGLDMYMRLLEEEIDIIESPDKEKPPEVFLELEYTGFIPDSYISDPEAKFEMYKKIASVDREGELEGLRGELENRFGTIPDDVESLLYIAEIKAIAKRLWIEKISERNNKIEIVFSRISMINPDKVISLIRLSGGNVTLNPNDMTRLYLKTEGFSLKDKALFLLEELRRIA